MSPKGSHEVVKKALNRRWMQRIPDDVDLIPETTSRLSKDTYVEPDFVIYRLGTPLDQLIVGDVLLVVEIAAPSLNYDMGPKAALYAAFGVRELWVVDAVKQTTRVFREPSEKGFGDARDFTASDLLSPLFAPSAFALRLDELQLI